MLEKFLEGSTLRGLVMLAMGFYILLERQDLTPVAIAMIGSGGLGVVISEKGKRDVQ